MLVEFMQPLPAKPNRSAAHAIANHRDVVAFIEKDGAWCRRVRQSSATRVQPAASIRNARNDISRTTPRAARHSRKPLAVPRPRAGAAPARRYARQGDPADAPSDAEWRAEPAERQSPAAADLCGSGHAAVIPRSRVAPHASASGTLAALVRQKHGDAAVASPTGTTACLMKRVNQRTASPPETTRCADPLFCRST